MADYDRDLVVTIAGAVSAYVSDADPEDVAIEVLTDLEAEGWRISHPNDTDGGAYEAASPGRPAAGPSDLRHRRRGPGR